MTTAWHVDDAALARWVDGTDGSVAGASVEQHLLACAECRARVPAQPVTDQAWARVADAVVVPRQTWVERLLRRSGLSEADARIVAVSPAFRGAWLVGLAVMLAFVTVAGGFGEGRGQWTFLLLAPLVPSLAVALGYDPELDEALETECATPYSKARMVLLRSLALILIGLPALTAANAALPGTIAFWWLVPAAGCTVLVLALSTWITPLTSVGVVGTVWLSLVGSRYRAGPPAALLEGDWVVAYVGVTAAAALLLVLRRRALATWRVR
jgi:hypothetical protein